MVLMTYTEEDIKRGDLIEPGWYLLEISRVNDKPAKDGKSMNTWVHFTILQREDGDKKFEKTPLSLCVSEKAVTMHKAFLASVGIILTEKGGGFDLTTMNLPGKKTRGMIVNSPFEGRMTNKLEDFQPLV